MSMSVSKRFVVIPEKKKLRVDVSADVLDELELYLLAAQEGQPSLTLDIIVEQLLDEALKKDRAFRSWLKQQKKVLAVTRTTKDAEPDPITPASTDTTQYDGLPHV